MKIETECKVEGSISAKAIILALYFLRILSVNEESFCGISTLEVSGAPLRTLEVDRGRPALYSAIVARV